MNEGMHKKQITREENAIVLDFLPHGHPMSGRRSPIAQVVGENHFILLEIIPKQDVVLQPHDIVYIGSEKREQVHHIGNKISINDLTQTAKMELPIVIKEMVMKNEKKFVDFINNAGPITTRLHQLELLPGIGKKHMWKIIEERDKAYFKDFEDIKERVSLIPEPAELIVRRIMEEMEGQAKYKIFVG